MKLDRQFHILFFASWASIHSLAIQLNPTVNGVDGSDNIQSPGQIRVSWIAESGDPSGFDIDLVHSDGTHGLMRPNIDLDWGEVVLTLPSGLRDGQYANGIYVNGHPILVKGPNFYVGSQPKPTTTTPISQTVTIKTTITGSPATKTATIASSSITSYGKPSTITSHTSFGSFTTNSSAIIYANTGGQFSTSIDTKGPSFSAEPTSATSPSSASKVPVGAIAGAVVGAVVLIIALLFLLCRRRRTDLNTHAHALVRVYSQPKSERTYTTYPEPPSSAYGHGTSGVIRENHELKERIQALENQQEALVSRLMTNGVMPPDYHDDSSSQPPPNVLPFGHRLSLHKTPI